MKKQDDKSFLQDIADMKKNITVHKEDNGVIKPVSYQAVCFNIPKSLFWEFKQYVLHQKSTSKAILNRSISDYLNSQLSVRLEEQDTTDERQRYNIQIRRDYIDKLKALAVYNRLTVTDVYISILKAII